MTSGARWVAVAVLLAATIIATVYGIWGWLNRGSEAPIDPDGPTACTTAADIFVHRIDMSIDSSIKAHRLFIAAMQTTASEFHKISSFAYSVGDLTLAANMYENATYFETLSAESEEEIVDIIEGSEEFKDVAYGLIVEDQSWEFLSSLLRSSGYEASEEGNMLLEFSDYFAGDPVVAGMLSEASSAMFAVARDFHDLAFLVDETSEVC